MASYTRVDFKSLCRLCISFSESSQDLFETDESKIFIEKIFDCLSIKVIFNAVPYTFSLS